MEKAIEFLRNKGVEVTDGGEILSGLPIDESGLDLRNEFAENTADDFGEYQIIMDQIFYIKYWWISIWSGF